MMMQNRIIKNLVITNLITKNRKEETINLKVIDSIY